MDRHITNVRMRAEQSGLQLHNASRNPADSPVNANLVESSFCDLSGARFTIAATTWDRWERECMKEMARHYPVTDLEHEANANRRVQLAKWTREATGKPEDHERCPYCSSTVTLADRPRICHYHQTLLARGEEL